MNERPITTLFMLESLDGKITSGNDDSLDPDKDWCNIVGVKEGLHQYYELEQTTDLYSLNTGRVMAKIGINEKKEIPPKTPCSFIIIDNKPHLKDTGLNYLCNHGKKIYLVTTNKNHPAYKLKDKYSNLIILEYQEFNISKVLKDLKEIYNIERITIQSGGTLNGLLLRENLLDYVHIVIAPLLVGGKDTSTLIDGESITKVEEINKLKSLKLIECQVLENSYIDLKYQVVK